MNKIEYLLVCLAEECAEVAQRCTKALRFGLSEVQDGQELTNEQRLKYELTDLYTLIYMLENEGLNIESIDPDASFLKEQKVKKYMNYVVTKGTLKL